MRHPHEVLDTQDGGPDDYLYMLQCTHSQENILKNNEGFTHTLSGIGD